MTGISGLGSNAGYVGGNTAASNPVSLSTESIDFALGGDANTVNASNADSLFSVLNTDILNSDNLAGVGSAIDTYTSSLSSSNVYDSPYTTPSAQYLTDLSDLKNAAASGNLGEAQSILATAKLAAPDNVAGGISTAISKGDTAGEAALMVEGTANISDYLVQQGYSATSAAAEASAITINGLSEHATDTPSSSAQTRTQQITDLATYAGDNPGTISSSPLLNIISTLLESKSGTAIDQSLTSLDALYGSSTPSATGNNV
ncbi:hypothetical protein HNQ77_001292 [Silvibacterium bohemicum]|uniref:Uncharacterized protein n=1 Tax=Silvibacterium bohemicum TaxID=1577686 RepID=A0A841JY33_9BACT|nr:hypothetical protein [Silvibacterium bohemicum]MBB6143348.1 hypothetical protein [Silvibacterium bohemicum]